MPEPACPPARARWSCATTAGRGAGHALRHPFAFRGEGINRIQVRTKATDGRQVYRAERPPPGPRQPPARPATPAAVAFWLRPPLGFVWMLGMVGLAVALGVFPIIRRLTSGWKPAAQRAALWRGRPVRARARHRAGRSGRPGPPVQRCRRAHPDPGAVAQVAAGQCLARAALAAHPHPHGAGADGQGSPRRRSATKSCATSPSWTSWWMKSCWPAAWTPARPTWARWRRWT
jgi:hypothetical protein